MNRRIPVALLVAAMVTALIASLATPGNADAATSRRTSWTDGDFDARFGASTHPGESNWSALGAGRDGLDVALSRGRITRAEFALQRALSFVRPARVERRFGDVREPALGEATLALRDLAASFRSLPRAQRAVARSFFTRPDDQVAEPVPEFPKYGSATVRNSCTANVCVHWAESGPHSPTLTDADADTVPDYAEEISEAVEFAWTTEVTGFGFAAPSGDAAATNRGPDGKVDVYLADIESTFGPAYVPLETSGTVYMVVDDDYSLSVLPSSDPADAPGFVADVISHELFHVIQNEYDFLEDRWLLEGSAAWMEDEVYDDLNYLDLRLDSVFGRSALAYPEVPVDYGAEGFEYGAGFFWKYLGELYGSAPGTPDRTLMRRILELSATDGPNSLEAVVDAIAERGYDFASDFTLFTVVNFVPETFYEEGAAYLDLLGRPALSGRATLTGGQRAAAGNFRVDHLSAQYVQFKPGKGISRSAKLKVVVDGPSPKGDPAAGLLVLRRSGSLAYFPIALDGSKKVAFGKGDVSAVILVLTNASSRFSCGHQTVLACQGLPLDDGQLFKVKGTAIQ